MVSDLEKPESLLSLSLLRGDTMRRWLSTIQARKGVLTESESVGTLILAFWSAEL